MPQQFNSPISESEREDLQHLLQANGFIVLAKIMESYLQAIREGATMASEHDPLGNREKLINDWAYVAAAKRFRDSLMQGVAFELSLLRKDKENSEMTDEEVKRRRKWSMLGMLGPIPASFK